MEIQRQKPVVEAYHYDIPNPEKEVEQSLQVSFSPLVSQDENYPKENSIIGTRLHFLLPFPEYVLSGSISQINHLIDRKVEGQEDLSREEIDEMVAPLFDLVKRLTYEVTEITTDEPGLNLNFGGAEPQQAGE